jgi:hypothetical protein
MIIYVLFWVTVIKCNAFLKVNVRITNVIQTESILINVNANGDGLRHSQIIIIVMTIP